MTRFLFNSMVSILAYSALALTSLVLTSPWAHASAELDDAEVRVARARDSYYRGLGTKDANALYKETIGSANKNMNNVLEKEQEKTLKTLGVEVIQNAPPHTPVKRGNFSGKRALAGAGTSGPGGTNLLPNVRSGGVIPSSDAPRKQEVIDGSQFKRSMLFPGKLGAPGKKKSSDADE